MASSRETTQADEPDLPHELVAELGAHGIEARMETELRGTLEQHVAGYTLYRLTPAAARRWKCRYRLMFQLGYFDGQNPAEVYARALIAALDAVGSSSAPQEQR